MVAVATLVVNKGERDPALKLDTVAPAVSHVGHAITPAELMVMGDVPLSPAEPTEAMGIPAGMLPTGTRPLESCKQSLPVVPAMQFAGV